MKKYSYIKLFLILLFIFLLSGCTGNYSNQQTSQQVNVSLNSDSQNNNVSVQQPATQKTVTNANLSNNKYYINTYGNKVHSPAYSDMVPAGASATCQDGTYSFSQSRRGTCSHHGGVAEWL